MHDCCNGVRTTTLKAPPEFFTTAFRLIPEIVFPKLIMSRLRRLYWSKCTPSGKYTVDYLHISPNCQYINLSRVSPNQLIKFPFIWYNYQVYPRKFRSKAITNVLWPLLSQNRIFWLQWIFLLNVLWGLLFKCSKGGFETTMGFGDTWQNVMAVRRDVQVINRLTYPIEVLLISITSVNVTRQSRQGNKVVISLYYAARYYRKDVYLVPSHIPAAYYMLYTQVITPTSEFLEAIICIKVFRTRENTQQGSLLTENNFQLPQIAFW